MNRLITKADEEAVSYVLQFPAKERGRALEDFVSSKLQKHGFKVLDDKRGMVDLIHGLSMLKVSEAPKMYARQVVYNTNVYGQPMRHDILLVSDKYRSGLIVEVKWNHSGGSVDEKYPFVYQSYLGIGLPFYIVSDGGGDRDFATKWVRSKVDGKSLVGTGNTADFDRFCKENLVGQARSD